MSQQLAAVNVEANELRYQLAMREEELCRSSSEAAAARKSLNALSSECASMRHQLSDLQHKLQEKTQALTTSNEKLAGQCDEIESLRSALTIARARSEHLFNEVAAGQAALSEAKKELESCKVSFLILFWLLSWEMLMLLTFFSVHAGEVFTSRAQGRLE